MTPTPTSYAVLGLLSLRTWTTYELAKQSERSLGFLFPRAERAVYLEAKRLVELGWAQSRKTSTGRRTSTVYKITAAGRRALRAWLAEPSAPTAIESEAGLKVFFADLAGTSELRATVDGIRADALASLVDLAGQAAATSAFPERMPTNILSMRLVTDLHETMHRWTLWAADAIAVLEAGDQAAIEQQTRETLRSIAASPPARS